MSMAWFYKRFSRKLKKIMKRTCNHDKVDKSPDGQNSLHPVGVLGFEQGNVNLTRAS